MPRARPRKGAKLWRPLTLSHDTAPRDSNTFVEQAAALQLEHTMNKSEITVFVETFESMSQPKSMTEYTVNVTEGRAAVIFFLKAPGNAQDQSHLKNDYRQCPYGTSYLLDSEVSLPPGPAHGQRMLFVDSDNTTLSLLLWCPLDYNWAHVATYEKHGDSIRALTRHGGWNRSTRWLYNSHSDHVAAHVRLYFVSTGKHISRAQITQSELVDDPLLRVLEYRKANPSALKTPTTVRSGDTATQGISVVETPSHISTLRQPPTAPRAHLLARNSSPCGRYDSNLPFDEQYRWTSGYYNTPLYGDLAVQYPQDYMNYIHTPVQMPGNGHYSSDGILQTLEPSDLPQKTSTPVKASDSNTSNGVRKTIRKMSVADKQSQEYRTVLHDPCKKNIKDTFGSVASPRITKIQYNPTPAKPAVKLPGGSLKTPAADSKSIVLSNSIPCPKKPRKTEITYRSATSDEYSRQVFEGPFFTEDLTSPRTKSPQKTSHDQDLENWWWSGNRFSRQQAFYDSMAAVDKNEISSQFEMSRLFIPVLESLAEYVEGQQQRPHHFNRWSSAPEWCMDRTAEGCTSYFDRDWGCPPSRIGRDLRYNPPRKVKFGHLSSIPVDFNPSARRFVFGTEV